MTRETSVWTYHDIKAGGLLGELQIVVGDYIEKHPNSSDRDIQQGTKLLINVVTPRRNELVGMGVVEDTGIRPCSISGRPVHQWAMMAVMPSKQKILNSKSKNTKKCPMCKGSGTVMKPQTTLEGYS